MAPKRKGAEHPREKETAPRLPGDDYDFDVVDESHELIVLAKKLAKGVKGKDGLVKLLKVGRVSRVHGQTCPVHARRSTPQSPPAYSLRP